MDPDALVHHYFGTDDPDAVDGPALAAGIERMRADLAIERDPDRRFALWTLMEVFDVAPAPADAFDDPALIRAAQDWLSAARDAGYA